MSSETSELLFFDTFSHETSEELNLDLVQFTKTVCVTEVRVIPLGARVQADFPGGVRLGATNPSQFEIEFFVNDLTKPGASTFESVGGIEYNQNGNIHVECEQRIPTDGLVLRGWYTTITLAVYGHLTKAIVHEPPQPQPVPSHSQPDPTADWVQHHSQVGVSVVGPDGGYLVEPARDPYVTTPYPDYQHQWPQAPDAYEPVAKEVYEGDDLQWDQRGRATPEDKSHTHPHPHPHWERKERERDLRHRGERDFREHGRECSPEYERRSVRGDYHYQRVQPHHRQWSGRPRTPPPPPAAAGEAEPPPADGGSPAVAFESLSPGDVESISEGEIPEAEGEGEVDKSAQLTPPGTPPPPGVVPVAPAPTPDDHTTDGEPFEPILSDEEIGDDGDGQDMDYDFGEYAEDPLKPFNPYNCELQAFVWLRDPALAQASDSGSELTRLSCLLDSVPAERVTAAHREEWVHAAEQVVGLLPVMLSADNQDVIDKLISWVGIGLDFEEALSQPQPGYKLRHIKAGVRLVEATCQCGADVTDRLLAKLNVHEKLIQLYHQDYMALSIKLMILRSLDASLRFKNAVELFLKSKEWNGYGKLLDMIQAKQLARVQFAITSLLQKLNLYEVLDRLNKSVAELVVEEGKENETNETELDIENIAYSLEEIIRVYNNAPTTISQPKRFLPVSAQFEMGPSSSYPDPYPALYTYFRTHRLLESFLILLTHPGTSCYSSIVTPIQEVISSLQDSEQGLWFLYAVPDTINPLVRVLLGDDSDTQLGLHLVYRLQALSHVDHLMKCHSDKKTDPDHPDVYEHLRSLFCLTFVAVGKMAVVHVLSRGNHIAVLLKYFKEKHVEKDAKVKKSPGKSFIADLITMTVKISDHVPFLQRYAKELIEIISKDSSQELNDLMSWLKPVENPSVFVYDDISGLVEMVKKNIENAVSLPGELVTAVRVLRYLGIPPRDTPLALATTDYRCTQLKYKCVLIQLFSLDGVAHLLAVLQKLCEHYEQPALHAARLAGRQGLALMSLVGPAVQLVRCVLAQVIQCRNTQYRDLTAVPLLLQTYSLMTAVPLTAQAHLYAQKVCRDIVQTLLAFTQPVAADPSSETEALTKSLWTLMMTEVLRYTVSTPNNFLPGLSLMSELLPLPLPLQVQSGAALAEEEVTRVVNSRKLWSAHLHCLSTLIHDIISTMCSSSYNPLLQLLRSVCVQLADLAAPTALTVTRAVLDCIVKAVPAAVDRPVTGHLMRLLTFLACLATHASVKAAIIQLTTRQAAPQAQAQRYPDLLVNLCHMLRTPHDSPTHVQAQECIVSVVQSLCHCELTLAGTAAGAAELYLANTLPPRDLLIPLVMVMLDHVSDARHSLTTAQPCLRTLLMLTEHDYGFYHLRSCLDKRPETLAGVLKRVAAMWSSDRQECVGVLSTLLELLRGCLTPDAPDEVLGLPARTIIMSAPELALTLGWQLHSEDNKHPLYTVHSLLQDSRADDETLETLCENVTELVRLLEEEGSKPHEPKEGGVSEVVLPPPEPLLAQFCGRPVYVTGGVDGDRLTAGYWLTVPPPDDQDSDMHQVGCDLVEAAQQDLPGLALAETVVTLCRHRPAPGDLDHSPHSSARPSSLATDNNARRPFIAPMRGRGFRGAVQRGDMFRSRPPNTSRPPSLHVDDFVALETCGQQPTGPTGYNKISMRVAQDMIATRVRGRPRPFGVDRGGRFFPTPYSRRDNGGGREGLWHGEGAGSGNFRQPPPDLRDTHFTGRPWAVKEGRDRFGTQHRHMRFFSR